MIDKISIGQRIRYYRLQKEWTITQLSDATGISARQIGHIERGERSCSLKTLIEIANAFRLPADELLVDNLVASNSKKDGDEYYILLDCTSQEEKIITKAAKALKAILSEHGV